MAVDNWKFVLISGLKLAKLEPNFPHMFCSTITLLKMLKIREFH